MTNLIEKIELIDDTITIQVLVEDSSEKQHLKGEHGVSFFISYGENSLIFDTGQSDLFIKNSQQMNISMDGMCSVILSHGHYDHTGGLPHLLNHLDSPLKVYIHPQALIEKYRSSIETERGKKSGYIGSPPLTETPKSVEIIKVTKPIITDENFILTGQIPRKSGNTEHLTGFIVDENGSVIADPIEDSQALILTTTEGLVIVTGCAHAGLANIIDYSKKITGIDKVKALVGGFHLLNSSDIEIEAIIERLQQEDIETIAPCHCTGKRAQVDLLRAFPGKVKSISTGHRFSISTRKIIGGSDITMGSLSDKSGSGLPDKATGATKNAQKICNHPVIVLFHGSRSKNANDDAVRLVTKLKELLPERTIEISFLEMTEPSFNETMERLTALRPAQITIIPAFLFNGIHLQRDLKTAVQEAEKIIGKGNVIIAPPLGTGNELVPLLAKRLSQVET
jgi:7,8-dihydropterin-6-yl-methyl-4-(beta-D-ribofuranosyl)aminobenzene 5'-phosphate synthase